jgi:hypothetical protein
MVARLGRAHHDVKWSSASCWARSGGELRDGRGPDVADEDIDESRGRGVPCDGCEGGVVLGLGRHGSIGGGIREQLVGGLPTKMWRRKALGYL